MKQPSICDKCNSRGYCRNREDDTRACIDFNKYPKGDGRLGEDWFSRPTITVARRGR